MPAKRVVLADVLPERKLNENTFGCSPGTKTGTRVRSHVSRERRPERGYIRQNSVILRKILVSAKFVSEILGPEMGAPILWAAGIFAFFLQENLHVHKIPRFRGGVGILGFFWGG